MSAARYHRIIGGASLFYYPAPFVHYPQAVSGGDCHVMVIKMDSLLKVGNIYRILYVAINYVMEKIREYSDELVGIREEEWQTFSSKKSPDTLKNPLFWELGKSAPKPQ